MSDETQAPIQKRSVFGWALIVLLTVALSCGFAVFLWFADHNEVAAEVLATVNIIVLIGGLIQLLYSGFMHLRNRT